MNPGQMVKHEVSSNCVKREGEESNSIHRLSTINQLLVKKLRSRLAYKHLQKHYFLMRAYCLRRVSSYIAWVVGTPVNEGYDEIGTNI